MNTKEIYYQRFKSDKEKFYEKVRKNLVGDCWIWIGCRDRKGYGTFRHKQGTLAHRFSYILKHGEIEEGFFVLHRCDNPSCVNPDHLFLGTALDNSNDMISKGRERHTRGENSPRAILSDDDAREIHRLRRVGLSTYKIAEMYGITRTSVSYLLKGKTWKDVWMEFNNV